MEINHCSADNAIVEISSLATSVFANCLAPDGSNLDPNSCIPEREIFETNNFEKISRRQFFLKNFPACKELNHVLIW